MPLPFELEPARTLVRRKDAGTGPDELTLSLDYESRFLRRKRLVTDQGPAVLVDLAETVSLDAGDVLVTGEGHRIRIVAAEEPLLEISGAGLARLAWHIGNRHTPCQIEPQRLLIRRDHVLADMLERLGAATREVSEPFTPEGGAYGIGRTHSHAH